ncbi:MAG: glycogen/starch synthase, partial [Alphaproteobacteria bacterium]|nr:glycogen/starch synthase [Alphaproteobacteria bacterium]
MSILNLGSAKNKFSFLPTNFNKHKFSINYGTPHNPLLRQMQNMGKKQCLTDKCWPESSQIHAWMITAETATFMKCGGLGMVASELPENYNSVFASQKSDITIITPMYLGDTGRKKCTFEDDVYTGAEGRQIKLKKLCTVKVPFMGSRNRFCHFKAEVYSGNLNGADYLFLHNDRFFSINPAAENPSGQGGCYVLNSLHVDEVERFAFLSKAVYCLLESIALNQIKNIRLPNMLLANDWHSGAISGLTKYLTLVKVYAERLAPETAEQLSNIPVIHIAHHMGYQGWDYNNTSKILNSLYEDLATLVLKNAKAVKNSNPRTANTLLVGDTYNQASCNMHLADRIVTVSKNYMEEVSREKSFGFDFRDILKIRKNCRSFFGIVNGYEKKLISPNAKKIEQINSYFGDTQFKVYNEHSLQNKLHNKKECIKLLSHLAADANYRQKVIPNIDTYGFDNILSVLHEAENIPFICMTSRLVEQKGYDIAVNAILRMADKYKNSPQDFPIFVLGGAGNKDLFHDLMALKDNT